MTLFKPKPLPEESLYSYLYRFAKGNNIDSLALLAGGEIISNLNYVIDNKQFREIKDIVEDEHMFESMLLNKYNFNFLRFEKNAQSKKVRDYYLNNTTRFCPVCLEEKNYHRMFWDVRIITTCSKHKRYLIDKCSKCHSKVKIKDLLSGTCECGKAYQMIEATHVETEVMRSQEIIFHSLISNTPIKTAHGESYKSDDFFSLFHSICWLLDGVAGSKNNNAKLLYGYQANNTDVITNLSELTTYVFSIIDSLNLEKLFSIYDHLRITNSRLKNKQMRTILNLDSKIKKHYLHYLFNIRQDLFSYPFQLFSKEELENCDFRYLTLNEAAKYLGHSYEYIKQLSNSGKLPHEYRIYREKKVVVFRISTLRLWKEQIESLLTIEDLKEHLGLGRDVILKLIQKKLLTPFLLTGKTPVYLFEKREVEELVAKLKNNNSTVASMDKNLVSVFQAYSEFKASVSEIISVIIDNNLATYTNSKEECSFKNIYTSRNDLNNHLLNTPFANQTHTYPRKGMIKI
ncbi:hypothetical protein CA600_06335 [Paenibacillus sp. VTT E-133280]|uniref:TniQ family protein n=1 Tax=Paenibacillus sp. VTT E-133280 TaxID=1986222 RepID=UPI000BA0A9AA|nr:TniQ family protein [Paenibacillus sp. VTT E-133280]OZQ68426.1 hypothetical protein CA600_06335 [Paenibacillus sp. VTT E-133280]